MSFLNIQIFQILKVFISKDVGYSNRQTFNSAYAILVGFTASEVIKILPRKSLK